MSRDLLELLHGQGWIGSEVLFQRSSFVEKDDFNHQVGAGKRLGLMKTRFGRLGMEIALSDVPDGEVERAEFKPGPAPAQHDTKPPAPPPAEPLLASPTSAKAESQPPRRTRPAWIHSTQPAADVKPAALEAQSFAEPSLEAHLHPGATAGQTRMPDEPHHQVGAAPAAAQAQPAEDTAMKQTKGAAHEGATPTIEPAKREEFILALLRTSGPLSLHEINAAIGEKPSSSIAGYVMRKMAGKKLVKKTGAGLRSPWEIRESKRGPRQAAAEPTKRAPKGKAKAAPKRIPPQHNLDAKLQFHRDSAERDAAARAKPAPGALDLRCALWNDGSLSIEGLEVKGRLLPGELRTLVTYLDATLQGKEA